MAKQQALNGKSSNGNGANLGFEEKLWKVTAVCLSAGLLGVGTYIATSPAPENIKVPLATVAYVSGMLGFAIKEALGGQTPAPAPAPDAKA